MSAAEPALPSADFPLWRFALDIYGRDGVAEACLALQDRHGVDVNLLLFGLWLTAEGRSLGDDPAAAAETLGRLSAEARRWHAGVVRPLRAARRSAGTCVGDLGPATRALREQLKADELEAERLELWLLFRATAPPPVGPGPSTAIRDRARRHVEAVRMLTGATWGEADVEAVERIVAAAEQA